MFSLHFLPSSQSQSCFLFFAIPHIRHTIIIIARSLTRKAAELCHCVSYTLTQLLTCAHSNCISQRENERGEMNLEKASQGWSLITDQISTSGRTTRIHGDLDPGGNYHRWNVQLHNTDVWRQCWEPIQCCSQAWRPHAQQQPSHPRSRLRPEK